MSRVYVFPPSEEDLLGSDASRESAVGVTDVMQEGDKLVRRYGDQIHLWRVGPGGSEWIAEVPVASLPDDAVTDLDPDEVRQPDDASGLPRAVEGIESSVRTRGA